MDPKKLEAARGAIIRQRVRENAAKLGLLSAGTAAAVRGGLGLVNLLQTNLRPAGRRSLLSPIPVEVPIPVEEHEEEKTAGDEVSGGGFFAGGKNTTPGGWWAALPLSVGATALGGYGGWKLADKLLDEQRKNQLEVELEKAKKEYEEALKGHSKLGRQLDEICDRLEKRAQEKQGASPYDYLGRTLGAIALLGLLSGGTGAYLGYKGTRKRSPLKLKEKAKRKLQLQRGQPAPIFAIPAPEPSHDSLEDEDLKLAAAPSPPPPPQLPPTPKSPSSPPAPPRPR